MQNIHITLTMMTAVTNAEGIRILNAIVVFSDSSSTSFFACAAKSGSIAMVPHTAFEFSEHLVIVLQGILAPVVSSTHDRSEHFKHSSHCPVTALSNQSTPFVPYAEHG